MFTYHLVLKYQVNEVVGVVKGNQRVTRSCYAIQSKAAMQITFLDIQGESKKGMHEPTEKLEEVRVKPDDFKKKKLRLDQIWKKI